MSFMFFIPPIFWVGSHFPLLAPLAPWTRMSEIAKPVAGTEPEWKGFLFSIIVENKVKITCAQLLGRFRGEGQACRNRHWIRLAVRECTCMCLCVSVCVQTAEPFGGENRTMQPSPGPVWATERDKRERKGGRKKDSSLAVRWKKFAHSSQWSKALSRNFDAR